MAEAAATMRIMADRDSIHSHHTFDYIEIPALDIDAAERFYRDALGWRFTEYGPGYRGIVTADGREAGGLTQVGEVARGTLLVVLFTRDLFSTREAILAAGGTLTRDIFEFPGGFRLHFMDVSGNELGVWAFPEGVTAPSQIPATSTE
ncbi:VOC family protein [Demequina litorisediminis]|uniref:VOC family protein n=1 Tax=Demequina litorisediminis TaxID=1849022 RepID=UPI0024E16D83|nr:VOC family protein [Demequina litorisediminis]